jgi:hypothetical protein
MSRSSQFVLFNCIEGDTFCVQDLCTSSKRYSINSVEVTTTNQENALRWCLTVLEVVGEICVNFHLFSGYCVIFYVVLNYNFRVPFKNIHGGNAKSDCRNLRLANLTLLRDDYLPDSLHWHLGCGK